MSIILKGIDLPKEDDFIALEIHKGEYRIYYTKGATIREKRGEAIQIPTPHGRLIDADALETIFKDMAKCEWNQKVSPISWAYAFEDTIDEIDNAPTILDEEGK